MWKKKVFFVVITFCSVVWSYEYPRPIDGHFSQKGQDKFLNEKIFKNKKGGVFVELGAHDGISFSNTFFFEKNLGWIGICVEPNPLIFEKLVKNRQCYCEQACVSNSSGQKQFLKCSGYILEMYSGLLDNYDERHLERIDNEIELYGGAKELITVECLTPMDLFRKYSLSYVDLLSIDIEGGEKEVVESIDFDNVKINIIVVENNFNETDIRDFLFSKSFRYIARLGKDDIYQNELCI